MDKNFLVLGIKICSCFRREILEKIEKYLIQVTRNKKQETKKSEKSLIIYTPNPEIVMYAQKNPWFKKIVNSAQINIPDGAGIVWAGKLFGYPIRERVGGADLAYELVKLAEKKGFNIGLIGGSPNLALKSLECLKTKHPKLNGWAESGPDIKIKYQISPPEADPPRAENIKNKENLYSTIHHPLASPYPDVTSGEGGSSIIQIDYGKWNLDDFIARVKKQNTKVLFVGFGFPKQELFIREIAAKLDNIVLMAVGGTFAYWSGRITRAPKWIQTIGLEWLYRLLKEPWRIKRQTVLPEFVVKTISAKISSKGGSASGGKNQR